MRYDFKGQKAVTVTEWQILTPADRIACVFDDEQLARSRFKACSIGFKLVKVERSVSVVDQIVPVKETPKLAVVA